TQTHKTQHAEPCKKTRVDTFSSDHKRPIIIVDQPHKKHSNLLTATTRFHKALGIMMFHKSTKICFFVCITWKQTAMLNICMNENLTKMNLCALSDTSF